MKNNTWWMVLNPYPDGRKPTVRHTSFNEASAEAKRIAAKTGKKCHILKLVGTWHPPGNQLFENRDNDSIETSNWSW